MSLGKEIPLTRLHGFQKHHLKLHAQAIVFARLFLHRGTPPSLLRSHHAILSPILRFGKGTDRCTRNPLWIYVPSLSCPCTVSRLFGLGAVTTSF